MFYDTRKGDHGLPRNPFKSCVVPRPIGWITSISAAGAVNLAPYSFFNGVAGEPPMVMFATNGRKPDGSGKDSVANCEGTGEFVVNIATWALREAMNRTSLHAPGAVDEFELAGLETEASALVRPPRVKASPIHLECRFHQTVDLPARGPESRNAIVIGEVIGIHIADSVLTEGLVDMEKVKPIARLGYLDYTRVDHVFSMRRPG